MKASGCAAGGCCKPVKSRGMCPAHYMAWSRADKPTAGDPARPLVPRSAAVQRIAGVPPLQCVACHALVVADPGVGEPVVAAAVRNHRRFRWAKAAA